MIFSKTRKNQSFLIDSIYQSSNSSNRFANGGDEENRTPVQKYSYLSLYKFSSLFKFLNNVSNEQPII